MKSKLIQFFLVAFVLGVAAFAVTAIFADAPTVFAQTEGSAGGFVPCGNTADNPCTIHHLVRGFIVIINYLITMAGFVAVAAIVYAGFLMVSSQGEGMLKEAKGRFSGAIIGLVLVALAFVLVNALLSGSFSLGICNGSKILTSPSEYINGTGCGD